MTTPAITVQKKNAAEMDKIIAKVETSVAKNSPFEN
jgi:hypothetical protein